MLTLIPQESFHLESFLANGKAQVENYLRDYFTGKQPSQRLKEAMLYSLEAGGKRLRPILSMAACSAGGGKSEAVLPFAAAIECIHTYSLIHDDLPAMDDDDLRRGKPTNHKVYGDATAILAGDGLLTEAFSIMAKESKQVPAEIRLAIIERVANAAGCLGMVGGQQLDLDHENTPTTLKQLENIHIHKTGCLLTASVEVGAIAAGLKGKELQPFTTYGQAVGFAFQIVDDVLDVTGGSEIGKSQKSDLKHNKATFVSLLGIEASLQRAREEIDKAISAVAKYGAKAQALQALARYVIDRKF